MWKKRGRGKNQEVAQPVRLGTHLSRSTAYQEDCARLCLSIILMKLNRHVWPELGETMEWTTPAFEEICLNCEINSYASARLQ